MTVNVSLADGSGTCVQVDYDHLVADLIALATSRMRVSAATLGHEKVICHLVLSGTVLPRDVTIRDSGLKDGDDVTAVVRPRVEFCSTES